MLLVVHAFLRCGATWLARAPLQSGLMYSVWLVQIKRASMAGASPGTIKRTALRSIINFEVPAVLLFLQASCSGRLVSAHHLLATLLWTGAQSLIDKTNQRKISKLAPAVVCVHVAAVQQQIAPSPCNNLHTDSSSCPGPYHCISFELPGMPISCKGQAHCMSVLQCYGPGHDAQAFSRVQGKMLGSISLPTGMKPGILPCHLVLLSC